MPDQLARLHPAKVDSTDLGGCDIGYTIQIVVFA